MQAQYGSVLLPAGLSVVTTRRELLETPAQMPYGFKVAADIETVIFGTSQADITNTLAGIEAGLAQPYQDFTWFRDDGGIALQLLNATSTTGVRVVRGPDYPNGTGGFEYSPGGGRTMTFSVEAEYPLAVGGLIILEWTETVTVEGGDSEKDFIRPVNGAPILTTLFLQTPFYATQTGQAVGLNGYPTPPGPLWPGARLRGPKLSRTSPKRSGRNYREFVVDWAYSFGSVEPLSAVPNAPP